MIFRIKLLKTSHIDLVLKLCDTQVLDFDRVRDGPFKTNRHRRQVIGVLNQLQLRSTVECFSFEFDAQWLAVENLEEDAKVMLADFFRVVEHVQVHLLSRSQRASPWLNLEYLLVQDLLLKGLLFAGRAGICPRFHLDLRIIRHLEVPISLHSANIFE